MGTVQFAMRGSNSNNIIVAGQHAYVGHYNGITYKEFPELRQNNTNIYKADFVGKTAVLVGIKYKKIAYETGVVYILKQK